MLLAGCETIERKPGQTVQAFCEDWAFMRWTPTGDLSDGHHSYRYWLNDCLRREYGRGEHLRDGEVPVVQP